MAHVAIDDRVYLTRGFSRVPMVWSASMDPRQLGYLTFVAECDRLTNMVNDLAAGSGSSSSGFASL